jgi:hypothetical protein
VREHDWGFRDVSHKEIEAANDRAAARLSKTPTATAAHYDRRIGRLLIDLSTGVSIAFRPHECSGLRTGQTGAIDQDRNFTIRTWVAFPRHRRGRLSAWLLEGFLGSRRWMATQLGKAGGSATSPAKTSAVRANGKLGGRPKKAHAVGVA